MHYTSEAIVLKRIKYSDSAYILHLFTEKMGHQAFMYYRKKKSPASSIISPLSIVEIEASHLPKKNIQSLKSIHAGIILNEIPYKMQKNAIALFLSEIYYECTKNEVENKTLFKFLKTSIQIFDIIDNNVNYFHLINLLDLTKQLGFAPTNNYDNINRYFNLINGKFETYRSNDCADVEESKILSELLTIKDIQNFKHTKNIATTTILDLLITFFSVHISNFKTPKSLEVFREMH